MYVHVVVWVPLSAAPMAMHLDSLIPGLLNLTPKCLPTIETSELILKACVGYCLWTRK